jgi:hypothetical protein
MGLFKLPPWLSFDAYIDRGAAGVPARRKDRGGVMQTQNLQNNPMHSSQAPGIAQVTTRGSTSCA